MSCCAYFRGRDCLQTYEDHITQALEACERLRPYYGRWMEKAFGTADAAALAVEFHDLGKLARAYTAGNRARYRHEVLGAYFALRSVQTEARYYVAAAVALHHEPMILAAYAGELGERAIHVSTLRAMLKDSDLSLGCTPNYSYRPEVAAALREWASRPPTADDVADAFQELAVYLSGGAPQEVRVKRLRVAGLLHVLTVCDNWGARGRPGEGTFISRYMAASELGL
ncbi:CRISPR-associated protein [Pyrobaculum neutrophilum]|uniref:CRISPR-associated HD domain protein n=1 Tax=Pyrobaculum neutrophilum (strain DSM 2338 / JCM 9278 / NBRC 100436 / V24Sta) TaxID=444157 RepID=B1YE50_PYRNV|nr:CRISPR-associated protein [Pyrobaculum neutrophilum]ACB40063.1 CRISPR-associated HD domain protein [Pyrobaculum neutrophilum V24Sta]